jgi:hypothetical protein
MRLTEDTIIECPSCKHQSAPLIAQALPPHDKKAICGNCGRTLGFIAKDKNKRKLDHRPNGQPKPSDLMEIKGKSYCEICLREKYQLGRKGYFEVHHISKDPSDNSINNLLVVCKACHQFIHYLQVYLNDHMRDYTDAENA